MGASRFVVQEGHFHIADQNRFVLNGWFDGMDMGAEAFGVFLDGRRLETEVRIFSDETVRQKYAKYDQKVEKEYVIIVRLPLAFKKYHKLCLRLSNGNTAYERRVSQLLKLQKQLNYRITSIQITGANCVVNGWVASEKPVKINVFDGAKEPVQCEVSHFPKPDVAFEYREAERLFDSGFSVTVPTSGTKRLELQITDGETSVARKFSAVDKNRLVVYVKKAHYYMKRNGLKQAGKRAVNEMYELVGDTGNYMKWRKKNMLSAKELEQQRQDRGNPASIVYVLTIYQDTLHFTEAALSLKNQTYDYWKWVLVCTTAEKEKALERIHGHVPPERIIFVQADKQSGHQQRIHLAIAKATELMSGNNEAWLALFRATDVIEPNALYDCMKLAAQNASMDMLYTDEDQISEDGKTYRDPIFKSDFNIDMLRAFNYLGKMVLLRSDLACKLGPWKVEYAEDAAYDYYLRAVEEATDIGHLQQAVYHFRENSRQTHFAGAAALNAHYERQGIPAVVEPSQVPGIYHTVYRWNETPLVSINIPNKDHIEDLDTCIQSILKHCTYPNYEIIIIENNSTQERTFAYYKEMEKQDKRIRVIYWKEEFNYAKIMNFGAAHSEGEFILQMNNDTEVIAHNFIEEMLGYCMRSDVGVCGARLYYFDDTIQHAGVVIGLGGICGEGFQGFPKENRGYQNRIVCPQDYSAVTGACLMTKKSVYEEVGGMDDQLQIAYNDIDYCLKVRATGRLVVYNPFAMLHHYEYKSRGAEDTPAKLARYNREVDLFTSRWADLISKGDPYYNPNLTRRYQDFSLRRIELLK